MDSDKDFIPPRGWPGQFAEEQPVGPGNMV
jgi:hypothetical protein